MITSTFTLALLLAPAATDRAVTPVEVGGPAPASVAAPAPASVAAPAATPPPTVGAPAPVEDAAAPAAAPAQPPLTTDPTLYWVDAPPPVPPPPASTRPERPKRPDRPIRWRLDALASLGTTLLRDPAWRAFDSDRSALQFGLTLRGDARLGKGRVFLGGGASFRRFAGRGAPYGSFNTDILVREPIGFARLSVMTVEGVDVFAQAGGGVSIVDLGLGSSSSASQRSLLGLVDGLAGVALYLPKRVLARRGASRVTAGLELGAGYTWRSDLVAQPKVTTDAEPISTSSARLGDVALRGFTWRFGVFIRFQ